MMERGEGLPGKPYRPLFRSEEQLNESRNVSVSESSTHQVAYEWISTELMDGRLLLLTR